MTAPGARTAAARRRCSAPAVGLTADHPEVLVELDVHLGTVVEGHLDLVVALLVADLGARDPAAAGLGEGGLAGAPERCAGDGDGGALGGGGPAPRGRDARSGGAQHGDDACDDGELPVDAHDCLL